MLKVRLRKCVIPVLFLVIPAYAGIQTKYTFYNIS